MAIERACALSVIESAQVRGAMFGDDDVRVHAAERYRPARLRPARRCG